MSESTRTFRDCACGCGGDVFGSEGAMRLACYQREDREEKAAMLGLEMGAAARDYAVSKGRE